MPPSITCIPSVVSMASRRSCCAISTSSVLARTRLRSTRPSSHGSPRRSSRAAGLRSTEAATSRVISPMSTMWLKPTCWPVGHRACRRLPAMSRAVRVTASSSSCRRSATRQGRQIEPLFGPPRPGDIQAFPGGHLGRARGAWLRSRGPVQGGDRQNGRLVSRPADTSRTERPPRDRRSIEVRRAQVGEAATRPSTSRATLRRPQAATVSRRGH